MLHAAGPVMMSWRLNNQTLHRPSEDAVGDQFVTAYKQTGNAAAKGHFKSTMHEPYAESTPSW